MSYEMPLLPALIRAADAAMTSGAVAQNQHEAVHVLRERARRARRMARSINDETVARTLQDYADELEARATARECHEGAASRG